MPKYLSGRVKRTNQGALTTDRYQYLGLSQAEPNLGDPSLADVEANLPVGPQYQIISVVGKPGERYWIPRGGGLIPGSISVYDEGILKPSGGFSSITQLDFVGAAVTVLSYLNPDNSPGIGVTIKVFAPGNEGELIFNSSDEFSTSSKLKYDSITGTLYAADKLLVGAGGTVITTNAAGFVGINTTNPTQELHVRGDIRLTGTIYDYNNNAGTPTYLIAKNNFGGVSWVDPATVRSGAGGIYQSIQFQNNVGLVDGASNFVYDEINSRVGIGSTQPKVLLDVLGVSSFTGSTQMSQLNVTGVTTTGTLAVTGTSTTRNLIVTGVSTLGFITGTNAYFTGIVTAAKFVGSVDLTNLNVSGVGTIGTLKVTGLATAKDLQVYESTSLNTLYVSGISTFNTQLNVNNLKVTGIGTFDNIKFDTNTVSTTNGNLTIDSAGGTTQINDSLYINDTTESTSKDTGSIITEGGVGIEKSLFVGGETHLATLGGITTVGGNLYVAGDLFVGNDISYDEINGRIAKFSEYLETKDFTATGISSLNNLKVTGISTFNNSVYFTDNVSIGNSNTDLVTINSSVNSDIVPSQNGNYNLGSTSNKWNNIYANNFSGQFTGNIDTATRLQTPRSIDLSGDVEGVGIGTTFDGSKDVVISTTLAVTGVVAAGYGSSTQVAKFTVDSKGRLTSASNVDIDFTNAKVTRAGYADTAGVSTNLANGTIYQIPYQTAANNTAFISTTSADTGFILTYNKNSAPSWISPGNLTGARAGYADTAGLATDLKINGTNQLVYQKANNDTDVLDAGTPNYLLQSNGGTSAPSWVSATNLKVDYANTAGLATDLSFPSNIGKSRLVVQNGPTDTTMVAAGTTGYILKSNGGTSEPEWIAQSSLSASTAGYADNAGIATNIKGGSANQIVYQSGQNTTNFISTIGADQGHILQYNTSPSLPFTWVTPTGLTVGSALSATDLKINGTNQLVYQKANNDTAVLGAGRTNQVLVSLGGTLAPDWVTLDTAITRSNTNISVTQQNYTGTNPITAAGLAITITTGTNAYGTVASNAYGTRYVSTSSPPTGIGSDGDIWYQITA